MFYKGVFWFDDGVAGGSQNRLRYMEYSSSVGLAGEEIGVVVYKALVRARLGCQNIANLVRSTEQARWLL